MTQPVLWTLQGVTLSGNRQPRLQDVSLEIRAGATAVIGYSGAGKTSLLNLLVGFERPDAGRLSGSLPRNNGRLPLFWVPQNDGLWPHLTAREHLEVVRCSTQAAQGDGSAVGADAKASAWGCDATKLLDAFDLQDRADAYPETLSQGERARLSVARALASGADVLVMDEPLAHVDPARVGRYWQVVGDHCAARGASLIIATHSPEIALREAESAICLNEGRAAWAGPVDELYHSPPTPELAALLGAANWLSAEEAARWLGARQSGEGCYRPEQITVLPAPDGPLVVQAARFAGSVAEVNLQDEPTGETRRFYHRPSGDALRPGDRVWLKLGLLLVLLLGAIGCGNSAGGPQLEVKSVRSWSMPPDGPRIPAPRALAVGPEHELYVLDNAGRVLVLDEEGALVRQWRMPESEVGNPEGICILRDGRILVADTHYHRVVFFDRAGNVLGMRGELGEQPGQFIYPVAVTEDESGNVYVCEYGGNDRVQRFSPEGDFLVEFGSHGTGPGQFQRPSGVVWHDGKVYVADAFNNRLQVFDDAGKFLRILDATDSAGGLHYPYDLTRSRAGDLYVVEYGAGRVSRLDLDGRVLGRFGSTGAGEGGFATPWGLAIDGDSRLLVADTGNRRIVEIGL